MISTKNLIDDIREIPSRWIFEYYWNLPQPLNGQRVQVQSMFNPTERTPSMYFYFVEARNDYRYKCFSTNNQGDGVNLLSSTKGISSGQAIQLILTDYNKYVSKHGHSKINREYSDHTSFEVSDIITRDWNKLDQDYWTFYGISSDTLNQFNVKPLESITMITETNSGKRFSTISHSNMYGYFTADDELYKIYQPHNKKYKFMKLQDYLQGVNQLTYEKPYLVICSSLKDCMCLSELGYTNIETVAPDSENTMIKPMYIDTFKSRYKGIVTLFDSDKAGKESSLKYLNEYDIPTALLPIMKDLSDAVAVKGMDLVRETLTPILRKALSL